MRRVNCAWCVPALTFVVAWASLHPGACAAAEHDVEPIAVFRIRDRDGGERLITEASGGGVGKPAGTEVAFLALPHRRWWPGFVPVFAIERTNRLELRRRPPAGQENFLDPLFFASPPADEPEAPRIAGRWKCTGTRGGIRDSRFEWELTADGERVAGRFDQNTDYRFAFITGGTFRTNRLELRVEYINDAFIVTGTLDDNRLRGTWRRTDATEAGDWEGVRAVLPPVRLPGGEAVALYEWRRDGDRSRRYRLEGESAGEGWTRVARPIGRVWPARSRPAATDR